MEHLPRRLPIVVAPEVGESLTSWISRFSLAVRTTPGLLVAALGVPLRQTASDSHPRWADVLLTPAAARAVTAATGLPEPTLAGTHISAFDGALVDFTALEPASEPSLRTVAGEQWVLTGRSRACPTCLADSGGVWQTWWRLGFAGVCPIHDIVLADRCPGCGRLLASGNRFPARFPAAPGWECGATWHGGSCTYDLRTISRPDAPSGASGAQQRICGLRRGDTVRLAGRVLPACDYISEWRGVMNVMRGTGHVDGLDQWAPQVRQAWAAEANRLHTSTGATTRMWAPGSADLCAGLLAATAETMAATTPREAQDAVDTLVGHARGWPRRGGGTRWRDAENLSALGGPLRRARPRQARVAGLLAATARVRLDPRYLPTMLHEPLYAREFAPLLPHTARLSGRLYAALAVARATCAGSWAHAARLIGIGEAKGARLSDVITRRVSDTAALARAVDAAATQLAADEVDYRSRRQALAGLTSVQPVALRQLLAPLPVTEARRVHAAAWVWEALACSPAAWSPAHVGARTAGARYDSQQEGYRRFCRIVDDPISEGLTALGLALIGAE